MRHRIRPVQGLLPLEFAGPEQGLWRLRISCRFEFLRSDLLCFSTAKHPERSRHKSIPHPCPFPSALSHTDLACPISRPFSRPEVRALLDLYAPLSQSSHPVA